MNGCSARATARFLFAAACAFDLVGCARSPALFPGATSVSDLAPDERVIVGRIRYANGGLSQLLPEPYVSSWPRFTYDYDHLQSPRYDPPLKQPPFGAEGGIFAFRAKRRPVYWDALIVETQKLAGDHVLWTLPITLKLPPSSARCVYVGTVVIDIGGPQKKPSIWETFRGVELPKSQVRATVIDDFERDHAVLASYAAGCDLQRALAEPPSAEELRPLLEARAAREKADDAHSNPERDRLRRR